MNKHLLVLSVVLGLSISSVSAGVTREELAQLADKANKARFVQNIILPAAAVAYEHNKGTISETKTTLLKITDELLKNPGMAANLALEEEPPLIVSLSDVIANVLIVDKPHGGGSLTGAGSHFRIDAGSLKRSLITAAVTRTVCEVLSVLARHKVNKWIKEGFPGDGWMRDRRLMRIQAFLVTKMVSHLIVEIASSLAADKGNCQAKNSELLDSVIPVLNYGLAEFEGHVLAQQLIEIEEGLAVK